MTADAPDDGVETGSSPDAAGTAEPRGGDLVHRHRLSTRIWHWLNALTLLRHADERADDLQRPPAALLGPVWRERRSGLAADRRRSRSAAISGSARRDSDTTGVLGHWHGRRRQAAARAPSPAGRRFPSQLRPAPARALAPRFRLGAGRPGLSLYWLWSLAQPPLQRDLAPQPRASSRRAISGRTSRHHARLRFPNGAAALRYNILQKLSLSRRALRAAAADRPDRAHHVAGDGRGLAVAARPVRRPAVGALDPLHRRAGCSSPSSSSTSSWWCWPGRSTRSAR